MKHHVILISLIAATTACTQTPKLDQSQYWQRIAVSETTYMRGPKAQQILNQDIARCVTELRELERLGQIKNAIPTDFSGRVIDPDALELAGYEAPDRNQYLYSENTEYTDFYGCMGHKGWERTTSVPFDAAKRAEDNFYKNHIDYKYNSRFGDKKPATSQDKGDYAGVNE
ncbi:MAG: hypothetical protein ACPGRX_00270 [Bdellovibrionales bacterium]